MRCTSFVLPLLLLALSPAISSAQAPCLNGDCGPAVVVDDGHGAYGDGAYVDAAYSDGGGGGMIARLRARCQSGECVPHGYGAPDLFYNFWVGPDCGGAAAQLYIAPHPVPAEVGHTFYTYQPLMPHEMLYPHHRYYHRYYDGGRGLNRTSVHWSKSPSYMARNMLGYFSIPR